MIRLDAIYVTTVTSVFNGQTVQTTTDTLRVSYAELDLVGGNVMAMVQRGTVIDGVFTANMPTLRIQLNADGAFASQDNSWHGTVASAGAITAGLKQAFDGFLLASGAVTGTAE